MLPLKSVTYLNVGLCLGLALLLIVACRNDKPQRAKNNSHTPSQSLPDLVYFHASITTQELGCGTGQDPLGTRIYIANQGEVDVQGFSIRLNETIYTIDEVIPASSGYDLWVSQVAMTAEIVLDVHNEILEADETNNTFSGQISIPSFAPTCTATPTITLPQGS